MSDVITILKDDHRTVEELFQRFEATTDRAKATRRKLADRIITELSVHAAVEEQILYPVTRALDEEAHEQTLEALEEHHLVKLTLAELEKMDPADERFAAKVKVLAENVRHHVKEEEGTMFPQLREQLSRNDLREMGEALREAKRTAPTRPHPAAPDTPPGNIVVGLVSGVLDRLRDSARAVVRS